MARRSASAFRALGILGYVNIADYVIIIPTQIRKAFSSQMNSIRFQCSTEKMAACTNLMFETISSFSAVWNFRCFRSTNLVPRWSSS